MDILMRSVGKGGANSRHDVLLVQQLLNHNIGFIGPRARLSVDGFCGSATVDAIQEYQRRVVKLHVIDGRVDPGGRTLQKLLIWSSNSKHLADSVRSVQAIQSTKSAPITPVTAVAPGGGKDQKYTNSPNEVVATRTSLMPAQLSDALRKAWPELTIDGAHTLVAQYVQETGGGMHCYCWNLGNVKGVPSKPHMYLRSTWEVYPIAKANEIIAASKGLARPATPEEVKRHVGTTPAGKMVVSFTPPDSHSMFRAYSSLVEGATAWTDRYKRTARNHPGFLEALNKGDCNSFAKTLQQDGYYTGPEEIYARNMTKAKKQLDDTLGSK